ncbi:hypothetical protein HGRIS_005472 [Hohenbuehelia grisea]|uniref:Hydrophobin n=1 Tax=Hohenbuehelia grisea TaxID=104357 RepID=A0ABR3JXT9_9AGAR
MMLWSQVFTLLFAHLAYLVVAQSSIELETIHVTPNLAPTGTLRDFMPKTTAYTITPTPTVVPLPASQCTESLVCCKHVEPKVAEQVSVLMKGFNIVLWGSEALVGVGCNSANTTENCVQSLACCQYADDFHGLVTLGCVHAQAD